MDYVTGQMGMAIGQKFVKQEFDESAKSSVSCCFLWVFFFSIVSLEYDHL